MKVPPFERVADVARRNARERPDKIVFHFEGRATCYGDFDANSNRAANALMSLGQKPDDRVAYLGKNSDIYFELVMAVAKAGVGNSCSRLTSWRNADTRIAARSPCAARTASSRLATSLYS